MEAPSPGNWSKLPLDILISVFERLSFVDFHRAKAVCSHWYYGSKQTAPSKSRSPLLMLFPDDGGCVLYNQDEDMVYKTEREFRGSRFLASCGKWLLMLDSRSRLYIIDMFSQNRIDLPPLESVQLDECVLKRVEDRDSEFRWESTDGSCFRNVSADEMRGRIWVDGKADELAVVWFFDSPAGSLLFYNKSFSHYDVIPLREFDVPKMLAGVVGLVLWGYRLYILTNRGFVRVIDISGQQGFKEITASDPSPTFALPAMGYKFSMAVTRAGELLLVTTVNERSKKQESFQVYKKDPDAEADDYMPDLVEVDSLGDEALLLDLGITVPANHVLGIKPNSVYFTRHEKICVRSLGRPPALPTYEVDICVFDLATKTLEHFPAPSNMNIKDARWFFPMT